MAVVSWRRFLPLHLVLGGLALCLFFVNCSGGSSGGPAPISVEGGLGVMTKLSEVPYSVDSSDFTIENYKLSATSGPIYFQFVSACSTKCPVVVVSMPYTGITWSNDPQDLAWAAKDPSGAGILAADVNGPDYLEGSGEVIPYYNSSISDAVGFGGIFLKSEVSTIIVYNRFYLGRSLDQYANDFTQVLNHLQNFPSIDISQVATIGSSMGGFVALHGSRTAKVKPKVMVGVTPLLDLPNQFDFMSSVATRIYGNPSLLLSTQNFFRSYLRRMKNVKEFYTSELLAQQNSTSKVLVIHDTWDTVVPISQWQQFGSIRSLDSFIFQHASEIDHNSFKIDHSQASEGFSNNAALPIYMSYILSRLKPDSQSKNVYYDSSVLLTTLTQVKEAQDRGQNISWLKNFMTDLCTSNLMMKDFTGALVTLAGSQFVGGVLLNIWNAPTSIEDGCNYLALNSTMFD